MSDVHLLFAGRPHIYPFAGRPHIYPWACESPESPGRYFDYEPRGCRACLTAAVAHAVNRPQTTITMYDLDGRIFRGTPMPIAALRRIRELLDECDPLRVRAEQALVPLCEAVVKYRSEHELEREALLAEDAQEEARWRAEEEAARERAERVREAGEAMLASHRLSEGYADELDDAGLRSEEREQLIRGDDE